jgi:hypothetical protein
VLHHALQHQWDQHRRLKNVTARAHLGCARVKIPPYYRSILARSIFAEWGLVKANTRRGVFRVKIRPSFALSRSDESRPGARFRALFLKTHDLIAKPLTLWRIMR